MDGHEHTGLNDDALESEIEAALGVDRSPEFLPRVRARIASQRVGESGWGWFHSWRWASGAAVVIAAAILGVWMLRNPGPTLGEEGTANTSDLEVRSSGPEQPAAVPELPVKSPVGRVPERESRIRGPVVRAPGQARHSEVEQPEVMISPEEAGALRQLFAAISTRRLETALLPDLDAALEPPSPIEDIILEPILVGPLASLEGE